MLTLANAVSCLRIPLGLLFIYDNHLTRLLLIALAMVTDFFDGILARRFASHSRFGILLDPATDKFFVASVLGTLLLEGSMTWLQALCFITRDILIFAYGFFLIWKGRWKDYTFRALMSGKCITAFQFIVLLFLTYGFIFSNLFYALFIPLGCVALGELCLGDYRSKKVFEN